jgi:YVTN family beta-propeller protein
MGEPIPVASERALGLALGEGAVWATAHEDGMLVRIDPTSRRVDKVKVGDLPVGVVVAEGSVWVANRGSGTVSRVDPGTMEVTAEIEVGQNPTWIGAAAGSVWVANQTDGTVSRIGAETGKTIGSPIRIAPAADSSASGDAAAHAVAVAGDSLWVSSLSAETVSRIDPSR